MSVTVSGLLAGIPVSVTRDEDNFSGDTWLVDNARLIQLERESVSLGPLLTCAPSVSDDRSFLITVGSMLDSNSIKFSGDLPDPGDLDPNVIV